MPAPSISSWLNRRPSITSHSRAVKNSSVTPWMPVAQFRLPYTTCAPPREVGAAAATAAISRWIAHASSSVMVSWLPEPIRTPPASTEPESTMIMFEPRLWICSATRAWAPAPTATIVMTAPTPITMPSMVSALRSLFTRSARTAMRALAHALPHTPMPSSSAHSSPGDGCRRAAASGGRPSPDSLT